MKIKIYLFFLLLTAMIQAQEVIYYDKDWQPTTKENHVYYRPMPLKKVGELALLVDYHKNGKMQFQGYIYPNDEHKYVGDVYWYDENGFDNGMRQSINESSERELTYYNQDGSIWQKIKYKENGEKSEITTYVSGKELFKGNLISYDQYSGAFSPKLPDDYYDRPFQETKEPTFIEVPPPPMMVETVPVMGSESEEEPMEIKPREHYFEVIYWENGKKAKESKFEIGEYGSGKLVEEKFWDNAGKLISEINFKNSSKEKKYLKVDYFTRNNFAVQVKSQWEMKNESREGKSIFYDSNGKLIREETYKQGLILEDVNYLSSNVSNKRIYQNNEPFEGNFTDESGPFEFSYTLEKGKKIGKEIVKNVETDKVVAEGSYKDGLPFDGKFISTERYIVSNYKNGILDGIQTIYQNFYDDIPAEEYEMKNGKREGFRKIYQYGELKYESIYKNDTIFSGKISEGNEELIYVNGNLTERQIFTGDYEGLGIVEKYVNNQLDQVIYFNFTINGNPQESYQGKYKNGKPFQGYFYGNVIVDDIHLIDYYENGTIKYQYSFDIIEQMDNYRHYIYNQKAEFKNGKIVNGPEFLSPNKNGFLKLDYKDNKVNELEINLFAMHYFNRINFIREKNEITVSEFESPYKVKIFPKDNFVTANLYENDKLIKEQKPIGEVKEGTPNSSTLYYFRDNQIKTYSIPRDNFDEFEGIDRHLFAVKILSIFPLKMNLDDVMDHFSKAFQTEDFDHIFDVGDNSLIPISGEEYLSFLEYDENGKPGFGIRIKQEKNGEILAEGIEDDKVKKSVKVKSISELKANDHKILQDLMHKLLNE